MKLRGEWDDSVPYVEVDPKRMWQIMFNLLDNAVKFTEEGEIVLKLGFEREPNSGTGVLSISVSDAGTGMSEEEQKRVMQPFASLSENGEHEIGAGLGVTICRHLIERMNGTFELRSEPGRGSVFDIRIPGVKNGKQYTIPKQEYLDAVRSGKGTDAPGNVMHLRECFVVPEEGADLQFIETAIKTMPNYFVGYETTVHFISEEEFAKNHSGIPHGGFVFRNGKTDDTTSHVMEFSLKLDSNPQFTSSVLTAFARAMYRLHFEQGKCGAFTVLDIPFALLSPKNPADLRKFML